MLAIVIFCVGDRYIKQFNSTFRVSVQGYCDKHKYDLIILDKMIDEESGPFNKKKFFYQRLLVADKFSQYDYVVTMDSDMFINENAPAFPDVPGDKVGAVNERKYLENYEWREMVQIKHGWEKTGKNWYSLSHETKDYHDHINGGLVIYKPKYHAKLFKDLYYSEINNWQKYHQDDQSLLSSYLIDNNLIYWLDQRFNRVWFFWKEIFYPNFDLLPEYLKRKYIKNFTTLNYVSHFTGMGDINYILD